MIPLQLVARSPEAPQVSQPGFDLVHLLVPPPAQGQVKKVVVADDPAIYVVDLKNGKEKKLKSKDDQQSVRFFEGELRIALEKLKGLADDQSEVKLRARDELTQRVDEFQVEAEKLRQALEEARQTKKVEHNLTSPDKVTILQLLEAKMREQREKKQAVVRDQAELAQGLQRLAERLERLAVEQRQLADELRRIQTQSPGR